MIRTPVPVLAALALVLLLGPGAGAVLAQSTPVAPPAPAGSAMRLDCPRFPGKSAFVDTIDNRYLPLIPGTTFVYEGHEDGKAQRNVVEVTHDTKVILGVKTVVVQDTVRDRRGALIEKTLDWFAQDKDGNVWYFGEASKDYENGQVVSTEGSWEAGVKGAKAGIIMKANSRVGDTYHKKCAPGEAEDMAKVLDLSTSVTVPFGPGSSDNALLTKEWMPLECGVVEHKFYTPCVGMVRAVGVKGGKAETVLVDVKKPSREADARCGAAPGR